MHFPRTLHTTIPLLLVLALALASCGSATTPSAAEGATLPATEMGCFEGLAVVPVSGTAPITADEAAARARMGLGERASGAGMLRSSKLVRVLATEGHPGILGGRQVWLLMLAAPTENAKPTYALVDAASGQLLNACTPLQ